MKKLPEVRLPEDNDDNKAWEDEVSDIAPMSQPQEKPQAPLVISEVSNSISYEGLYNANSFNKLDVGNTDNLDKNTASKFVKGKLNIDARLDIHGLTEKNAFIAVKKFIQNGYAKGFRCLLIITGKGIKNNDSPWYEAKGVIKEAFPEWLNNDDIRPFILSASQATQNDGGSGAFYVLLKRKRTSDKTKKFK